MKWSLKTKLLYFCVHRTVDLARIQMKSISSMSDWKVKQCRFKTKKSFLFFHFFFTSDWSLSTILWTELNQLKIGISGICSNYFTFFLYFLVCKLIVNKKNTNVRLSNLEFETILVFMFKVNWIDSQQVVNFSGKCIFK